MSERKERTRALFKKGQKCLIPSFVYDGELGEDIIIFEPAQVRNGRYRVYIRYREIENGIVSCCR